LPNKKIPPEFPGFFLTSPPPPQYFKIFTFLVHDSSRSPCGAPCFRWNPKVGRGGGGVDLEAALHLGTSLMITRTMRYDFQNCPCTQRLVLYCISNEVYCASCVQRANSFDGYCSSCNSIKNSIMASVAIRHRSKPFDIRIETRGS